MRRLAGVNGLDINGWPEPGGGLEHTCRQPATVKGLRSQ